MIIYFLLIVCSIHDNSSISFVSLCNYDGLILFKAFEWLVQFCQLEDLSPYI